MIKLIKNSKGYVSSETIILSGIVLGISVFVFMEMQDRENKIANNVMESMETAIETGVVNNPWE